MATVTLQLPGDLPPEVAAAQEEFDREMRLHAAVFFYERFLVSQGRAAEIAGMTRVEFIDALGRLQVSAIQTSAEEILAEVEAQRRG